MKNIILLFACTLLILENAIAQYNSEIIGKVIDSVSTETLFYATVSLQQQNQIINFSTTDEFGNFQFKPIQPGEYEISVSMTGYAKKIYAKVDVHHDEIRFIKLELNPNELLPTFTVYADKLVDGEFVGERITEKEISELAARTAASIVSQTTAGVYNQDGGDEGGIYIYGSRADATLYIIDGVRVEGFAYVPKNAIEEITVYTGGIPAKYGDVTGGIIEIKTKSYSGIF